MPKRINKIVFATSSPSRKKMIKEIGNIGIKFLFKPHKTNEEEVKKNLLLKKNNAKQITKILAKKKSLSIKKNKNIIVGSDTLVEVGGITIDKAETLNDAFKKIKMLSGKKHHIFTSVYMSQNNKKIWSHTERTSISVRKLSNSEIKNYIKNNANVVLNTAGCYQAEKMGPTIFKKIEGDFYNVLGFPIIPFLLFLKKFKHYK